MKPKLMLDTDILAKICHPTDFRDVQQWFRELLEGGVAAPELLVSVLAYYELRRALQDKGATESLERLDVLAKHLRYVPMTSDIARRATALHQSLAQEGISDAALLVAAQAIAEGAVLITSDVDLRRVPGLAVKDWTEIDLAMSHDNQSSMSADTRPKGPRTGASSPACYAAALNDCGGDPVTQEHYISKSLLQRFGKKFFVEGLPWIPEGRARELTGSTLTAGVLCRRHNNALSPLDRTIGKLYDVLLAAQHRHENVNVQVFHGEDLERWSLKMLLGLMAMGVRVGDRIERITNPPESWLRILFGEAEMPERCGFYYVGDPIEGFDSDRLDVALARYGAGDPEAGDIFGVTVKLLGFQFVVTPVLALDSIKEATPVRRWHRPCAFKLGEQGAGLIRLLWKTTSSPQDLVLVLKSPPPEAGG